MTMLDVVPLECLESANAVSLRATSPRHELRLFGINTRVHLGLFTPSSLAMLPRSFALIPVPAPAGQVPYGADSSSADNACRCEDKADPTSHRTGDSKAS